MKFDHLLIDGDILLWKVTSVCETEIEWGDGFHTRHSSLSDVKALIEMAINSAKEELGHRKTEVIIALTGSSNFRKQLYPDYKGNRAGNKPLAFSAATAYMRENFEVRCIEGIEADDVMGILATSGRCPNSCIVSDDKDLLQIPGYVFRPRTGELIKVDPKAGERHHMVQTLTGDRVDNYPGCPRVGEVTAEKIIGDIPRTGWWSAVVKAYEKAGQTEADALVQARLAKILDSKHFDRKTRRPKLWEPKKTPSTPATT